MLLILAVHQQVSDGADVWIEFGLGAPTLIGGVSILWEAAKASLYRLEGLPTGETEYQLIRDGIPNNRGGHTDLIAFTQREIFEMTKVRLKVIQEKTGYGSSIFELKLYKSGYTPTTPPPVTVTGTTGTTTTSTTIPPKIWELTCPSAGIRGSEACLVRPAVRLCSCGVLLGSAPWRAL